MNVRPALFSAPMVLALLQNRKTHTRRGKCSWQEGDLLYVRETIHKGPEGEARFTADNAPCDGAWIWKRDIIPAIHMPRSFSRLTLRVVTVRGERLQDITEADAMAEGVELESADPPFWYIPGVHPHSLTAIGVEEKRERPAAACYGKLWDIINGPGAWDSNPMVAVVAFEVIRANVQKLPFATPTGAKKPRAQVAYGKVPPDHDLYPGLAL